MYRYEDYNLHIERWLAKLNGDAKKMSRQLMTERLFKRGDYLLREGQVSKASYIVRKGVLRKFHMAGEKEITTELLFRDDFAMSLQSYAMQVPSTEAIMAIEDGEAWEISATDFDQLKRLHPEFWELDLMLTEHYAMWLESRLAELRSLDAQERYARLLQRQPHIVQSVPLTYIASYLGMTLETLSRVRAKI
jgi:CRP-like cAMP-binding protein